MTGRIMTVPIVVACLLLATAPTQALETTGVAVTRFTKFVPIARDAVIPAGETVRFPVDARNYARVSLLIAGDTSPGADHIGIVTLFGPPLVPAAGPRPLPIGQEGRIAVSFLEPILGPAMVIAIHNNSDADVTLTISAYLAN